MGCWGWVTEPREQPRGERSGGYGVRVRGDQELVGGGGRGRSIGGFCRPLPLRRLEGYGGRGGARDYGEINHGLAPVACYILVTPAGVGEAGRATRPFLKALLRACRT